MANVCPLDKTLPRLKGVQVKKVPRSGGLKDAFDPKGHLLQPPVPLHDDDYSFTDSLQYVLIGLDVIGEIVIYGYNDIIQL
jgi:hypothetical protein